MNYSIISSLFIVLTFSKSMVFSQDKDLDLEEIMTGKEFIGFWPENHSWLPSGKITFKWNPDKEINAQNFIVENFKPQKMEYKDISEIPSWNIKKHISNNSLKNSIISSSAFTAFKKNVKENRLFYKLSEKIRYYIFGGDCVQYGLLASGRISMVVENNLKPWDYMALINIIEESGGIITDWKGKELDIFSKGNVVASISKKSHEEFLKLQI